MVNTSRISNVISRMGWASLASVGITRKQVANFLGRTQISPEQMKMLEEMRTANSMSRSPFRSTEIWTQLSRQFEDWFWWEGIGEVETQRMNNFFSSPHPGDTKLLRYACWMYYQQLKHRDKLALLSKIPPTVNATSGLSFEFDGLRVSWDQLISIDTVYSMAEADPSILTEPVVILDLGAGWGRMGYVLKKANPLCTYVICDLPEALLVSSTYLPRLLKEEKVHTFVEMRYGEISKQVLQKGGLFFLGTQDIERFTDKSIDFFINIASFQEMTLTQVDEYFDLIEQKVDGVFFTQQLRDSKSHAYQLGEITGLEKYPFKSKWDRVYLRNAAFSDLYFETAFVVK